MRFWISGPRMFGGLIRPGISFGGPRWSAAPQRRAPAVDYVYVIEGDHGLVKIGISRDPNVRLATLQTGSPHRLRVASVVPCQCAAEVEAEAHAMLTSHRGNGEWFACSPNVATAAIYAAAERLGVDLTAQDFIAAGPSFLARMTPYLVIGGLIALAFLDASYNAHP